jgi:hypothetical protein
MDAVFVCKADQYLFLLRYSLSAYWGLKAGP